MEDLWWIFSVSLCVKLLLIPAYRSTDFEVHRHWLALTSSLPLSRWYLDTSSPWTLDYPPLFGHFSLLLSLPASLIDSTITDLVAGQNYAAPSAVVFLRLSVAITDLLLLAGIHRVTRKLPHPRRRLALALVLWSPALLIVDHIHFQYNGFLLGILLISLSFLVEGWDLAGGVTFAVLICSKHLFMVAAPVYFVYLLRHYCNGDWGRAVSRFLVMGSAVSVVFIATFGPFAYYGQIHQVFRRLFPFGRGLCHAYWAPNFWVFYILLDKILAFLLCKFGFSVRTPEASFTGGLVGDSSSFAVLPQVNPIIALILVLLAMIPCLVKTFLRPRPENIIRWVAYAFTCSFMFGWHVHEKASLHITIPLGIIATNSMEDARHYFLLSIVSCYSMFPLLFESQEYPIKVLLLATYSILMWAGFSSHFRRSGAPEAAKKKNAKSSGSQHVLIGPFASCYLLGLVFTEIWGQFMHPYIFGSRFPFLPLMLVSLYCGIGMMYSWIWQLRQVIACT
ncbi:putative dolichyl pyrophosphate Glc1Man9GlcNAc2 alpha-1,3-glucosyltransferase [Apostasia shenzhenica]|uniref:Alpha-1,3-glucosyltransferase n=1 Tax=Apostasia shenzhenica TaxID=1088818 RepID=A0A2I0ATK8_9ASPA|nr:putative dolichyl pyrophosphate Glc1Man9GlcNAc2 alpha-1,3-glucosyltransferase [Apostasia shenzhenica]